MELEQIHSHGPQSALIMLRQGGGGRCGSLIV